MSPFSVLPPEPEPDTEPTEPFAVQRCPHCGGLTAVPLSLVTSRCALCDARIDVTPPHTGGRGTPADGETSPY